MGWLGKVHDARVFSNSSLYERGQSGKLFPHITEQFAGVDVPVVMLGGCMISPTAMFDEAIP